MPHFHEIRQSIAILILKILGIQAVIALSDFLIGKLFIQLGLHELYMSTWDFFFSHLLSTIWLLYIIIKWTSTYYVINSDEISVTTGIIRKKKSSYDIRGIQSCETSQGIWGRIFGYGTIHLENPLLKSDIFLRNISHPHQYATIIDKSHKRAIKTSPLTDVMIKK